MKESFSKEPETLLSVLGRMLRSLLGKKTAQDQIRDHMFNTSKPNK